MRRNDISLLAAAFFAATLLPAAAGAESYEDMTAPGMTPAQIVGIMEKAGYVADVDMGMRDDPTIIAEGGQFLGEFHGCQTTGPLPDRSCRRLIFMAVYTLRGEPSMAKLNAWNATRALGKVYWDTVGEVTLEMPINLIYGVSESYIVSSLNNWQIIMFSFDNYDIRPD